MTNNSKAGNWHRTMTLQIRSSISQHTRFPPGYSTSSKVKTSEKLKTMAKIHVTRMKKGHSLDLMSGERSENTTTPNRPTAIIIRI